MEKQYTMRFLIGHLSRKDKLMKFHYYPETDSLYIELSEKPGVDSQAIRTGVILDFDADGDLVGLDLDNASKFVNLSRLEVSALPFQDVSVAG
jgi:uncharacterized protein YuzE